MPGAIRLLSDHLQISSPMLGMSSLGRGGVLVILYLLEILPNYSI